MIAPLLPTGYERIKLVASFDELVSTSFGDGVNALCWARDLAGDFQEVVDRLAIEDGITTLEDSMLESLRVTASGKSAVETLLKDQQLLRDLGVSPVLNCIRGYSRDEATAIIATDVYSFHADSAPV